jgi:hypothetical protein
VGYVNLTLKPGLTMVANPLKATSNTVGSLISNVPDGTTIYKYTGAGYDINAFEFGEWGNPGMTLEPGEGAFISVPGTADVNLTFVGEVPQGALTTALPKGLSIKASQVPQTGAIDTVLGFPAEDGDTIYKWNTTTKNYDGAVFEFGSWAPASPVVNVGESVFVNKVNAGTWTRNFSVN